MREWREDHPTTRSQCTCRENRAGGREAPRAERAMELEVNSEAVDAGVETVEVVAGGEEGGSAALMEQQLMVTNPQELIVPTSEVRLAGRGKLGPRGWAGWPSN